MQKKLPNKFLYAGIGFALGALFIVAFFSSQLSPASCAPPVNEAEKNGWNLNVTSLQLPSEVMLFDKKIPLAIWEVRERFERDFYYNYNTADQLLLMWKRLGRWQPVIDSILDAANLSRDLKYLMLAESGGKNVSSPAKASGFWQFIPPTGQQYGLRIDDWIDDRLDPILSTQAAAKYLSKLKNQFGGDYYLACASYNMGEDGVAKNLDYQHQTNYWNLYLNEETSRYLVRIAVIKELIEHGPKYGFHFERMTPYKSLPAKTVTVQGPVASIADWAVKSGYSYKDVKVFNPRFIGKDLPRGTFEIRLPASEEDRTTVR